MSFARERYRTHIAKARALLEQISERLDEHSGRQAEAPRDWGFVGDLATLNDRLNDAASIIAPPMSDEDSHDTGEVQITVVRSR